MPFIAPLIPALIGIGGAATIAKVVGGRKSTTTLADGSADPLAIERERQTEAQKAADELKKRARRAGAGGRSSTILTTPLGATGSAPVSNKTLLGS